MTQKQQVAVVIPVYKTILSKDESLSLIQCINVLGDRPLIFVCSPTLDTSVYRLACKNKIEFKIECFEEKYFNDIHGYSKLMLSVFFYQRFKAYKYILIFQLDAWIFKDDLNEWCNKNFDYIGAPWIGWPWVNNVAKFLTIPREILTKIGYSNYNLVGNGGLSLRKVRSFIFNLKLLKKPVSKFTYAEDYFVSFFINSYNPFFRIPTEREALKFSFDINPEESFNLNMNQLPMGCHAWPKFKEFWASHIPGLTYD